MSDVSDPRAERSAAPERRGDASDSATLDPAVLADLRTTFGDDPETLRALFGLFLEGTQEHLRRADRALKAGDFAALRGAAHSLKGNCGIVGAGTLCVRAIELETAAVAEDPSQARQCLQAAQDELTRVTTALNTHGAGLA